MKITSHNNPWDHIIVEDFLSVDKFAEIKKIAMTEYKKYLRDGSNQNSRGACTKYFTEDIIPETNQFFKILPKHRGFKGNLKKLIHLTISPPNLKLPLHIDNVSRINTCILYIFPDKSKGTILADNPSCNDDGDHINADKKSHYEIEVPWKPNTLFVHNSIPNKTWHTYTGDHYRIILCLFLVQPDLVLHGDGRIPKTLIDIDSKYYE